MDQYYNQIEKIVKDKKIPPHVCNELTELLEIRQVAKLYNTKYRLICL